MMLQRGTLCDDIADSRLKQAIASGFNGFCAFVCRISDQYFSPLSGIDVFINSSLVSGACHA